MQPWGTPFLSWNQSVSMSSSNCYFLTWIQISQEAGKVVWYSHLLKNFPQFGVIYRAKGFGIINKTEIDFFWTSLAFSMIQRMLAIWSLVPLPFLNPAFTSGSSWFRHTLLKPGLKDFEHNLTSMWNEHTCTVVWTFLGIAFLWDWNVNWPFPVLWPLQTHLLTYWMQHFNSITF